MCSSSSDHDFLDRGLALQARLAFTSISAMLDLEEALFTIGGQRNQRWKSHQPQSLHEELFNRGVQFAQLGSRKRVGSAARPDMCARIKASSA